MSDETENHDLIEAVKLSVEAESRYFDVEGIPCTVGNDGQLQVMQKLECMLDAKQDNPSRRKGTAELSELDSFIAHINRYKQESTNVWANAYAASMVVVYNDHPEGADPSKAGWRDHRATYSCPLSPEWEAWTSNANEPMTQDVFAEWLDERMDDLATPADGKGPTPVEMLEMARNLQIYTQGVFTKKIDPATGQYSMVCKEEHTSESTKIPRSFACALRIFDGGAKYLVEMRVQFKLLRGAPVFSYAVHRAKELQADAFNEMRTRVESETGCSVFAGLA